MSTRKDRLFEAYELYGSIIVFIQRKIGLKAYIIRSQPCIPRLVAMSHI